MTEIVAVRFHSGGKEYYFDPRGLTIKPGEEVIIETAKGPEFGICAKGNTMVEEDQVVQPLRPVLRQATDKDRAALERNREREKEAMRVCQEKVAEHELDMDLVRCECSFDGNKLLFFFISEGRVDFRALVRDLAATLHARIELRQIGVRDESKLLGGLGICGRPFCCSAFLDQFQPVSIKMAKTQGLSLNPTKISGACGRLMCCLKYEQDAYEDAVKRLPKNDSFVETPDGAGNITAVDYLRETVTVRLEEAPEAPMRYQADEINVIRSGKGRRPEDYVAPPREELEKLRRVTPPPARPESREPEIPFAAPAAEEKRPARQQSGRPRQDRSRPETKPQQEAAPGQEKAKSGSRNHRRRHRGGGGKGKSEKS